MAQLPAEVTYGQWPHLADEWTRVVGPGERNDEEDAIIAAIDLRRRGVTGEE